jgi:putative ATPase
MNLFDLEREKNIEREAPLALRIRPRTLEEFVGQEEIVGPGKLLRRAIIADQLSSLIFWGPPGTGKTALAKIIANTTQAEFEQLNAVTSGVQDIRNVVQRAMERRGMFNRRTILFIDEIHRFNKAQQDALLPYVENGTVILIGATTENPYFEITPPLISRSRIFQFKPLTEENIRTILNIALKDEERGLGKYKIELEEEALKHLIDVANGDARSALNALELAVVTTKPDERGLRHITLEVAEESIQRRAVIYDKSGDSHYDTISAFIKSMRGSDPDAALYWLAKMIYAGEDPRFIARRMVIFASEDIGNADPHAISVATAVAHAVEYVGMPEAQLSLAQGATYLATAEKSNASYQGLIRALDDVKNDRTMPVPLHLRSSSYKSAKDLSRGEGYKYPHNYEGHFVEQEYIPEKRRYYEPSDNGYEKEIKERLKKWRGER